MIPHLRAVHDKMEHPGFIELGSVINASPLVISLDLERTMQLEFDKGDFIMPDDLILDLGDRVALSRMYTPNLYAILYRVRGTFGKAFIGSKAAALPVARVGDHVQGVVSLSGTDPQGGIVNVTGTADILITTGSAKVFVE